MNYKNHTKV